MIRHLNCATLRPVYGLRVVAHCLLVERPDGLLLVDSGLGAADLADSARLGRAWRAWMRPALDPAETAAAQVRALGHEVEDVTDIVLTHLDLDHVGGVADFPHARVHVTDAELEAALQPRGMEHGRYLAEQLRDVRWHTHVVPDDGEDWFGFESVAALGDDVRLVSLPGHSRGHAGVAVRDGERWWLHAGDAYYAASEIEDGGCPRRLRMLQRLNALDDGVRRDTAARLRTLAADHGDEVEVFCAHDRTELERYTPSR